MGKNRIKKHILVDGRGVPLSVMVTGANRHMENNPDYKARRWVVEVTHSWMNRFRKLLVRFEKIDISYLGLINFVCAFIAFRKIQVI